MVFALNPTPREVKTMMGNLVCRQFIKISCLYSYFHVIQVLLNFVCLVSHNITAGVQVDPL
jgi:hypothetical protein